MKKLFALLLALVMIVGLFAACGGGTEAPAATPAPEAPPAETPATGDEPETGIDGEIAVIVIGATHGFPVGVQWYANNKVNELQAQGFNAQLYVGETPEHQVQVVEQLMTRADELAGVVILPFDPTLQNAVRLIHDSGVPLVQFNRVIFEVPSDAKVVGDNFGIGFETARVFAERGITLEDRVLEMPGSNSSVVETRSQGFRAGLVEFMGWSPEEVEAMITRTDFTMWNRDTSRQLFEAFVGTTPQDQLDRYRFVFTQDDEIAIGVFNAIRAGNLPGDVSAIEVIGASAGKQEMYNMLNDGTWDDYFYVFSLTHPPNMIVESIEVLLRVLAGETFPAEPIFTPTTLVDGSNAYQFLNPDSPY
ncbi:MAG: substrate-binding domain-containing protein [Oscillospiraceae bacterium]|nr:substrate-binding domain-containing protein [Oscillospiraceae bacterium]